ncbi:MAG: hypothetical protein HC925_06755 [Coleofasciculaceae cyanobacterium SM2_3_26]|nr:hypothetical protein [Coleofasciculaceae cyanobacterium SM2_3_26]
MLPQPADENLLAPSSRQFSMLSILHEAPVFYLENYQLYRPNPEAFFCLRQYFEAIAQCSRQNLQEPLAADVPVWV